MSKNQYKAICKRITDRIVAFLDDGIIPWNKPWVGGSFNAPRSVSTGKIYRGANLIILSAAGYSSPWWLIFGQARKLGGAVRKGEKSYPIHYWKFPKVQDCPKCGGNDTQNCPHCDENGKYTGKFARLFSFNVFNASQVDGLPEKYYESIEAPTGCEFDPVEKAEEIVAGYKNAPQVFHDQSDRNYYSPSNDEIHLCEKDQFISTEEYYSTLFHEFTHSTGHESRLDRDGVTGIHHFGSHGYSKEELVAEFGSAFLCGIANIDKDDVVKNSAAYIQSWKKKLEENTDWIVWAGTRAAKAADHILGNEYTNLSN